MYKNNFVKTYIITPPNYSIAKRARELCTSYVGALFIIYFIRTQYLKYIIYIQIRCTPDAEDINTGHICNRKKNTLYNQKNFRNCFIKLNRLLVVLIAVRVARFYFYRSAKSTVIKMRQLEQRTSAIMTVFFFFQNVPVLRQNIASTHSPRNMYVYVGWPLFHVDCSSRRRNIILIKMYKTAETLSGQFLYWVFNFFQCLTAWVIPKRVKVLRLIIKILEFNRFYWKLAYMIYGNPIVDSWVVIIEIKKNI